MHFLNLVEAITKNLTSENIHTMVTLVENLIALAESMDKNSKGTDSSNNAG